MCMTIFTSRERDVEITGWIHHYVNPESGVIIIIIINSRSWSPHSHKLQVWEFGECCVCRRLFYLTWSLTATSHTHMGSRRQVSSRVWARCLLLSSRLNSRLAQTCWNCRLKGSYSVYTCIMRNQEELVRDSSLECSPSLVLFLCVASTTLQIPVSQWQTWATEIYLTRSLIIPVWSHFIADCFMKFMNMKCSFAQKDGALKTQE